MVDTMVGYLQRVENTLVAIDPAYSGQVALHPDMVRMVKHLLVALGVPAPNRATDLQFTIKSAAGNVNINGKSMMEIMGLMQPSAGN
jgi:hypothetical protein